MTLIVILWSHAKVLFGSHVSKSSLLFLMRNTFVGTVVSREALRRSIAHVVTVGCLYSISWRRSMLVLDGLDCLLLGAVFIVLFDLAGSLAHADLWFLFELISLVIVVGVIVADLR